MNAPLKLSSPSTKEYWEIPVLHIDSDVLVIDKPSGLPATPEPHAPDRPSLMQLLHVGVRDGKPWAREHQLGYVSQVHRLDVETSGVMVLARNKAALVALASAFGSNRPLLEYVTLVQGVPAGDEFEVNEPITGHARKIGMLRVDREKGKKARTLFRVVEKYRGWSLVRAVPYTVRPHQIRVHLRHLHHSIVGDRLYLGKPLYLSAFKTHYRLKPGKVERPLIGSTILHSETLDLPHPVTGDPIRVTAEWPKELRVAVKFLRLHALS